MAMAALRNLVAKVRIPGAAALRASRAPVPQATLPSPPPPKADLENALLVKNKIESAEPTVLYSGGNMIAECCELTEQSISLVSERHVQVSRAMLAVSFKYFYTSIGLGSILTFMDGYYYEAEFESEERQGAVEVEVYDKAEFESKERQCAVEVKVCDKAD